MKTNLLNVTIDNIKSYTFSGYMSTDQLDTISLDWLRERGVNPEESETFTVEGEFQISFDDDIPMCEILDLYLSYGNETLDILDRVNNLYELCEYIENNGDYLDWVSDREAMLTDYYYDMWREG
jgi:hypothetical protein